LLSYIRHFWRQFYPSDELQWYLQENGKAEDLCRALMMASDGGCMEEMVGSITAEVDVPTSQRVLASLDVIGTVGTAKLHVPKNKPVMC